MSFARARRFDTVALTFTTVALLAGCSGSEIPSTDDAGMRATGGSGTGGAGFGGGSETTGGAQTNGTGGNKAAGGTRAVGGNRATGGMQATGGAKSTGGSSASGAPTWAELYANYFASGTPGNCASSGCHGGSQSPKFTSASTMCSALKSLGIIGNGTASFETLLKWFNQGGSMPLNNTPTPANAVADITAWQKAGAVCP